MQKLHPCSLLKHILKEKSSYPTCRNICRTFLSVIREVTWTFNVLYILRTLITKKNSILIRTKMYTSL